MSLGLLSANFLLRARKFLVDKGFVEVTDDIYSIRDKGT